MSTSNPERMFPIMDDQNHRRFYWSIPWAMLAPHEEWASRNHDQSLARLAERGGLAPDEALAVLENRPWRGFPTPEEARARLRQAWREWETAALRRERDALAKAVKRANAALSIIESGVYDQAECMVYATRGKAAIAEETAAAKGVG